ncbi:VOC family protein [Myxococcota bacterium]|nr:VOC family protein [Myxococcota bacterium]
MAKTLHTMIRVFDLDRSIAFYRKTLGLELVDRFDFEDFTLAYLRNAENDFEVELTWNRDQTEPYVHGSGYGHLAVGVEDLDAEHARLAGAGCSVGKIVEMDHAGARLARIFFLDDPDGYRIEVIESAGRYR